MKDFAKKLEQYEKIIDNCCCWESIENETLKLLCLFSNCNSSFTHQGTEMLDRKYVIEKVSYLLQHRPIILDAKTRSIYARIRVESEEGLPPQKED